MQTVTVFHEELNRAMELKGVEFAELANKRRRAAGLIGGLAVIPLLIGFMIVTSSTNSLIAIYPALVFLGAWIAFYVSCIFAGNWVMVLANGGKYIQARRLSNNVMRISWATYPYSPLLQCVTNHFQLLLFDSRFVEVRTLSHALCATYEHFYRRHPLKANMTMLITNLEAIAMLSLGQNAEAKALFEKCLTAKSNTGRLILLYNIGVADANLKNFEEAEKRFSESCSCKGPMYLKLQFVYPCWAMALIKLGRADEARHLLDQSETHFARIQSFSIQRGTHHRALAHLHSYEGNFEEAEQHFLTAIDLMRKHLRNTHPTLTRCINELADFYSQRGDAEKAAKLRAEATESAEQLADESAQSEHLLLEWSKTNNVIEMLGSA